MLLVNKLHNISCFRYHKGTDFQANHNGFCNEQFIGWVVLDTTKVLIFKQITTLASKHPYIGCCFRYHKGTDFQANHNPLVCLIGKQLVVLDTTKVLIFKQITTRLQNLTIITCCFRYHKGTDFQANHNTKPSKVLDIPVVLDTTKVLIFKQITTITYKMFLMNCCFRYHKGTDFQANHNK